MRQTSHPAWLCYGAAIASVAVATVLRMLLHPALGSHLPFPTFFIAVMFAAWNGRLGPTLLCMALGALSAAYFFIPPENSIAIIRTEDLLSLAIFCLVGFVSLALSEALHKAARRAERSAQAHLEQREWFRVTLSSIGDAVIATDHQGAVTFMNSVAHSLTGWSEAEALGKPLTEVFNIIHEQTRAPVESSVSKVMSVGAIVGLANHTLLIARDGREIPIEDSGAPIKDNSGNLIGVVLVFRDATEQKRAAQRSSLLASIVQSSNDAIIGKTLDGIIVSWNAAAERIYGYTAAEAIGQPISVIIPPDKAFELADILQQVGQGERVEHSEAMRVRKDGRPIDVSVSISPIKDDIGQITGASAIARDITERKRNEARLRYLWEASSILASSLDLEVTLSSIAQAAVPGIADWCVVDLLTATGEVNRLAVAHVDPAKVELARAQHRWHPEDFNAPEGVGKVLRTRRSEFYPIIPEEVLIAGARDAEHLQIIRELGLTSAMIVPLVARDRVLGAITFVTSESGRHYDQSDLDLAQELARRAALAVDNAQLYRETQQALRLHQDVEERLSLLVDASGTLLGSLRLDDVLPAILDLARRSIAADAYAVWRMNSSDNQWHAVASAGLSEAYRVASLSAVGAGVVPVATYIIEDVDQDQVLDMRHEMYKAEGIRSLLVLPLKIHHENSGTLVFYFHQPHHFDESEVRIASALADLAASALGTADLYEEQSHMRTQAEEANRTKDEFLVTLSHELRTPLTAILGWISLLRTNKLDEATTTKAMETIERNTRAQTQLIEDILDVSRIITGKLSLASQPLSLDSIVEAALTSARPTALNKGVQLESSFDAVGLVAGDPNRLQQIVWNLVANAIKFTPRGGQVQVTLTKVDSQAEIRVIDTGQGISAEFLPHVFDRFRQADGTNTREHGGLGLGLSIVRHLTELHGGTVQVQSAGKGQGTTFTVRLPLLAVHRPDNGVGPATELEPATATADAADNGSVLSKRLQGLRILVVDDEPDSRTMIASALALHSAETRTAASAAQALAVLEGWRPDLLVSDIGMPGEDGYSLIRRVRARGPEQGGTIPALALTAYAGVKDNRRALEAGFQLHIAKPVTPDQLTTAIAGLVQQENTTPK